MFRKVLFAVMGLALALLLNSLLLTPADAAVPVADVYNWGYANLGSNQRVCQKIAFQPQMQASSTSSGQQPVQIRSEVVDNRYCAHLPKVSR
ncbi:hypothetical protein [Oscillatoria sp. FACHB-1406]|uniref:hypothetical protein n=1 Tax=Oscillatoria sp. FACHB-1406 TaxID=2692846 RepID=UPI001689AD19|nr:hypothetical protein [Oscillatoria sp. FACHB-1406]MBD2579833.1 hypothetical protein [Oscillatoria sp. FACHB-1406]